MSELTERLRRYEKTLNGWLIEAPYLGEAADEIERLEAALENIARRTKDRSETYYVWKVATDALE